MNRSERDNMSLDSVLLEIKREVVRKTLAKRGVALSQGEIEKIALETPYEKYREVPKMVHASTSQRARDLPGSRPARWWRRLMRFFIGRL